MNRGMGDMESEATKDKKKIRENETGGAGEDIWRQQWCLPLLFGFHEGGSFLPKAWITGVQNF